jgi:type II secretory pathway pseudopilin PulG
MRAHPIAVRSCRSRATSQDGYAMAALLVAMSVMAIFMTVALPVWNTQAQREKEAELVFRGEQYARAVMLYQRKFANTLPPSLDVLLNDRYLRKKYKDPITGKDFQLLSGASVQAQAGVPGGNVGGASRSGGQVTPRGTTGTGGSTTFSGPGGSTFGLQNGRTGAGSTSGFGLGAGVGAGPGGTVPGGIMGVTSTSSAKSLRLYNGRGIYNEWTFVAVQRNLTAGGGGPGADTPGRGGRGGRGNQTPGRGGDGTRPGSDSFRPGGGAGRGGFTPPTGTFGGQQPSGGRR